MFSIVKRIVYAWPDMDGKRTQVEHLLFLDFPGEWSLSPGSGAKNSLSCEVVYMCIAR